MKFKTWSDFERLAIKTESFDEMRDVLELVYPFVVKHEKALFNTSTVEEYIKEFISAHRNDESWPNYIVWEKEGFYQNDSIGDLSKVLSAKEFIEALTQTIDLALIY